jgi:hypothetical protein
VNARLAAALSDRYLLERELGQGGMATELVTEVILKDSLTVAARLMPLKRRVPSEIVGHVSDIRRAAASAADSGVTSHV